MFNFRYYSVMKTLSNIPVAILEGSGSVEATLISLWTCF